MTKLIAILLLALIQVNSVQAADDIDCENAMSQTAMNICAAKDATHAKEDLATAIQDARRDLHTAIDRSTDETWEIPRLRETLRLVNDLAAEQTSEGYDYDGNPENYVAPVYEKWASFKCETESLGSFGGSIRSLEVSSCLTDFYTQQKQNVEQMVAEALASRF